MRPLNVQIRLGNLRHNYRILKEMHGGKLLAVVKADAYGHGAVRCAFALADLADGFAVATIDEGIRLRESGITHPIVLLEGVFEASEYEAVEQYSLWPAVGNQWQLEALLVRHWKKPVKVWLKMDSGMHRTGFFPHDYASAYAALKQSEYVDSIVKFSHFSCADEPESGMTEIQMEAFDLGTKGLEGEESLANSAAILNIPEARRDWGRAGLALYGISPFGGSDDRLKPVMRLSTRIFGERVLQPHSPIGYGATFYTSKSTRVGLIACGYADGYPRRAPSNSPVAVDGKLTRVIGRVSMDMMTIELDASQEGLGHEVELWGDTVNINTVAEAAGTIPYELMCNIKRAKFTYIE